MTNIRTCSLGVGVVVASLFANSAIAAPLFLERIFPDTKITRVKTMYNADTNIFTQEARISAADAPITTAEYRQELDSLANNEEAPITDIVWNLEMEVDEQGNLVSGGTFELFGAVDFADSTGKTDLPFQLLLRGGIQEFGVGIYEGLQSNGFNSSLISYNILGLVTESAEGIDYAGYVGMLWTDDPTPLTGGGDRTNAAELWGSDWESDDSNLARAQADIFIVPAPSSILLFGLALIGLIRSKRK